MLHQKLCQPPYISTLVIFTNKFVVHIDTTAAKCIPFTNAFE